MFDDMKKLNANRSKEHFSLLIQAILPQIYKTLFDDAKKFIIKADHYY